MRASLGATTRAISTANQKAEDARARYEAGFGDELFGSNVVAVRETARGTRHQMEGLALSCSRSSKLAHQVHKS